MPTTIHKFSQFMSLITLEKCYFIEALKNKQTKKTTLTFKWNDQRLIMSLIFL